MSLKWIQWLHSTEAAVLKAVKPQTYQMHTSTDLHNIQLITLPCLWTSWNQRLHTLKLLHIIHLIQWPDHQGRPSWPKHSLAKCSTYAKRASRIKYLRRHKLLTPSMAIKWVSHQPQTLDNISRQITWTCFSRKYSLITTTLPSIKVSLVKRWRKRLKALNRIHHNESSKVQTLPTSRLT